MAASELVRRWAVAVVGVPIVVGLLYLGGWYLGGAVALFAGLGSLEVYRLAAHKGVAPFSGLGVAAAAGLVLCATARPGFTDFAPLALSLVSGLGIGLLAAALVARRADGSPLADVASTLFGVVYVGMALAYAPLVHALPAREGWGAGEAWAGLAIVALPLAATWIGDSIAFFAGTAWGRAKIAPSISPNKSWVGSWAGLAGAAAAAVVWYYVAGQRLTGSPIGGPVTAAGIGVLLGVGAQAGDFAESLLKREAGVKDSGTIFPGHGGVLDRLDALFFTLPLTYGALSLLDRLG